jgi:formylglycine-generating enzyme required for sulfatase activity
MDAREVTVGMFRRYCVESASPFPEQPSKSSDACPVVNVTWSEAKQYAEWAGKRLPTSWEWIAAALGNREFPWGDEVPADTTIHFPVWPDDVDWVPLATGSLPADVSPSGCLDMGGNAQEWVSDERGADGRRVNENSQREWRLSCGWELLGVGNSAGPPYSMTRWREADRRERMVGFRCAASR